MITYLKNKLHLKKNITFNKSLLIIILSAVMVFSCTKPEDIGQDIVAIPGEGVLLNFTDTITITTHSFIVDSIPTKYVSPQLLGSVYDPIFGTTAAGIYTQTRLANNNLDFGNNAVCDSIVFSLDYVGFYGDTAATQHIKVYQLDESMNVDSGYYSNRSLSLIQPPLFDDDVVFNLKDSVQLVGGKVKPHLRLRLPNSFGEMIISKSGQSELSNNEEFLKFIKGYYIIADQKLSGGGIASVRLNSNYSRVTLYYHNDKDTTFEYFVINENCAKFSYFNHFDYQNADPDFYNQVVLKDSTMDNQIFYIQPTAGVRTELNFPYIKELNKEHPAAVQKAEIILNIADVSDTAAYPVPPSISIVGINDKGENMFITDSYEGSTYYGGRYDANNNQYIFNITRTIQEMLLGTSYWHGFRIIINGEAISSKRAIFVGNKAAVNNTRLRVYFADVNP